jgi:hypothetical protein
MTEESKVRFKYQLAEHVLRNHGSNDDIQRGILAAWPDAALNKSRAQWYRRSFEKYGHCRGISASTKEIAS